jgi:glycosyltransferase involved in cell wall biosynthesis
MYPSKQKPFSGIFVKNQYEYLKSELKLDIDIYALPRSFTSTLKSVLKYLKFYLGFISFLFRSYNVIHVHFFGYHYFLGVLYKIFNPSTKLIVTVHGSDTQNFRKTIFSFFKTFINHIIAVGEEQAEEIKKISGFKSISVIPAGIDNRVFYKEETEKIYDFIFVGSFYEIKGIDILIDAIKVLQEPNLKFCFVGSGKYDKQIKHLQEICNIQLRKDISQNQIRILLNQSKYLVLPSRGDSFGLVVSEAMYCGTPAIVSNFGGMKDQVRHEINGFILSENTPEILAKTIDHAKKIEEYEYSKMSSKALKSNKQFSMKNTIFELLQIYQS